MGITWLRRALNLLVLVSMIVAVPFVHARPSPASTKHLILIDPAHGGSDAGVSLSKKLHEKNVTLLMASMLQRELQKSENFDVRLTRDKDKDVSLASRVKIVHALRPDIFIGLHVNAGFGQNSSGYEFYFPGFKRTPTPASSPPAKNESAEILTDMTKNKYLNRSVLLAQSMQRSMERVYPRKGRGLRDVPVTILDDLQIPAVVIEIGFATNAQDREKIMDGSTQKAVVRALGNGIKEYFR